MTGCLIKDLMLIKNQKQFLVIIGVIEEHVDKTCKRLAEVHKPRLQVSGSKFI